MKPIINDITTDFESPPNFSEIAQLRSNSNYEYPKRFEAIQRKFYPEISPLSLNDDPKRIFDRCTDLVKSRGWRLIALDKGALKLEATATTSILRFKDDIAIEVRRSNDHKSIVHMRSKSRLGKGDFGTNARRIESFFIDLSRAFAQSN